VTHFFSRKKLKPSNSLLLLQTNAEQALLTIQQLFWKCNREVLTVEQLQQRQGYLD